jgi:hypothetical protein
MVASLDSQEERDRLTRFLTVELPEGKGTGILGDVFLLLKANRCYMEKLPGQFNRELVQPLTENLLRLEPPSAFRPRLRKRRWCKLTDVPSHRLPPPGAWKRLSRKWKESSKRPSIKSIPPP